MSFLLFSMVVSQNLSFAERDRGMGIVVVAVGKIESQILEDLRLALAKAFDVQAAVGEAMPEPDYALNEKRGQYLSTAILERIARNKAYDSHERVLGVVDHDLYVPELNFVFGEASSKAAVISLARLRQERYGLPRDAALFRRRVLTEAIHELGHTYGLGHCENPRCVMFFSNSLPDTDRKGIEFCVKCKGRLGNLTY
jgi:archaemetzincin